MIIHWLVLFVLNLAGIVLAGYELYSHASLEIMRMQEDEDRLVVLACLAYNAGFLQNVPSKLNTDGKVAWANLKASRNRIIELEEHGSDKAHVE